MGQQVNPVLREAVNAVVNSFKKHSSDERSNVDVVEALQEFWQMKHSRGDNPHHGCVVHYDSQSHPHHVCYITLPGGSCFASFEFCETKEEAKHSAAKIALMNSVFNEHPSNIINSAAVTKIMSDASVVFPSPSNNLASPLNIFKEMLDTCKGESMLSFQQVMSVFQLLHWNGSLKAMRQRHCLRDEVIQYYSYRNIDKDMKTQMALDWVEREKDDVGVISREITKANSDIFEARMAGRELRFMKEKLEVLRHAQDQMSHHIVQ